MRREFSWRVPPLGDNRAVAFSGDGSLQCSQAVQKPTPQDHCVRNTRNSDSYNSSDDLKKGHVLPTPSSHGTSVGYSEKETHTALVDETPEHTNPLGDLGKSDSIHSFSYLQPQDTSSLNLSALEPHLSRLEKKRINLNLSKCLSPGKSLFINYDTVCALLDMISGDRSYAKLLPLNLSSRMISHQMCGRKKRPDDPPSHEQALLDKFQCVFPALLYELFELLQKKGSESSGLFFLRRCVFLFDFLLNLRHSSKSSNGLNGWEAVCLGCTCALPHDPSYEALPLLCSLCKEKLGPLSCLILPLVQEHCRDGNESIASLLLIAAFFRFSVDSFIKTLSRFLLKHTTSSTVERVFHSHEFTSSLFSHLDPIIHTLLFSSTMLKVKERLKVYQPSPWTTQELREKRQAASFISSPSAHKSSYSSPCSSSPSHRTTKTTTQESQSSDSCSTCHFDAPSHRSDARDILPMCHTLLFNVSVDAVFEVVDLIHEARRKKRLDKCQIDKLVFFVGSLAGYILDVCLTSHHKVYTLLRKLAQVMLKCVIHDLVSRIVWCQHRWLCQTRSCVAPDLPPPSFNLFQTIQKKITTLANKYRMEKSFKSLLGLIKPKIHKFQGKLFKKESLDGPNVPGLSSTCSPSPLLAKDGSKTTSQEDNFSHTEMSCDDAYHDTDVSGRKSCVEFPDKYLATHWIPAPKHLIESILSENGSYVFKTHTNHLQMLLKSNCLVKLGIGKKMTLPGGMDNTPLCGPSPYIFNFTSTRTPWLLYRYLPTNTLDHLGSFSFDTLVCLRILENHGQMKICSSHVESGLLEMLNDYHPRNILGGLSVVLPTSGSVDKAMIYPTLPPREPKRVAQGWRQRRPYEKKDSLEPNPIYGLCDLNSVFEEMEVDLKGYSEPTADHLETYLRQVIQKKGHRVVYYSEPPENSPSKADFHLSLDHTCLSKHNPLNNLSLDCSIYTEHFLNNFLNASQPQSLQAVSLLLTKYLHDTPRKMETVLQDTFLTEHISSSYNPSFVSSTIKSMMLQSSEIPTPMNQGRATKNTHRMFHHPPGHKELKEFQSSEGVSMTHSTEKHPKRETVFQLKTTTRRHPKRPITVHDPFDLSRPCHKEAPLDLHEEPFMTSPLCSAHFLHDTRRHSETSSVSPAPASSYHEDATPHLAKPFDETSSHLGDPLAMIQVSREESNTPTMEASPYCSLPNTATLPLTSEGQKKVDVAAQFRSRFWTWTVNVQEGFNFYKTLLPNHVAKSRPEEVTLAKCLKPVDSDVSGASCVRVFRWKRRVMLKKINYLTEILAYGRQAFKQWKKAVNLSDRLRRFQGDLFAWGVLPVRALHHPDLWVPLPKGYCEAQSSLLVSWSHQSRNPPLSGSTSLCRQKTPSLCTKNGQDTSVCRQSVSKSEPLRTPRVKRHSRTPLHSSVASQEKQPLVQLSCDGELDLANPFVWCHCSYSTLDLMHQQHLMTALQSKISLDNMICLFRNPFPLLKGSLAVQRELQKETQSLVSMITASLVTPAGQEVTRNLTKCDVPQTAHHTMMRERGSRRHGTRDLRDEGLKPFNTGTCGVTDTRQGHDKRPIIPYTVSSRPHWSAKHVSKPPQPPLMHQEEPDERDPQTVTLCAHWKRSALRRLGHTKDFYYLQPCPMIYVDTCRELFNVCHEEDERDACVFWSNMEIEIFLNRFFLTPKNFARIAQSIAATVVAKNLCSTCLADPLVFPVVTSDCRLKSKSHCVDLYYLLKYFFELKRFTQELKVRTPYPRTLPSYRVARRATVKEVIVKKLMLKLSQTYQELKAFNLRLVKFGLDTLLSMNGSYGKKSPVHLSINGGVLFQQPSEQDTMSCPQQLTPQQTPLPDRFFHLVAQLSLEVMKPQESFPVTGKTYQRTYEKFKENPQLCNTFFLPYFATEHQLVLYPSDAIPLTYSFKTLRSISTWDSFKNYIFDNDPRRKGTVFSPAASPRITLDAPYDGYIVPQFISGLIPSQALFTLPSDMRGLDPFIRIQDLVILDPPLLELPIPDPVHSTGVEVKVSASTHHTEAKHSRQMTPSMVTSNDSLSFPNTHNVSPHPTVFQEPPQGDCAPTIAQDDLCAPHHHVTTSFSTSTHSRPCPKNIWLYRLRNFLRHHHLGDESTLPTKVYEASHSTRLHLPGHHDTLEKTTSSWLQIPSSDHLTKSTCTTQQLKETIEWFTWASHDPVASTTQQEIYDQQTFRLMSPLHPSLHPGIAMVKEKPSSSSFLTESRDGKKRISLPSETSTRPHRDHSPTAQVTIKRAKGSEKKKNHGNPRLDHPNPTTPEATLTSFEFSLGKPDEDKQKALDKDDASPNILTMHTPHHLSAKTDPQPVGEEKGRVGNMPFVGIDPPVSSLNDTTHSAMEPSTTHTPSVNHTHNFSTQYRFIQPQLSRALDFERTLTKSAMKDPSGLQTHVDSPILSALLPPAYSSWAPDSHDPDLIEYFSATPWSTLNTPIHSPLTKNKISDACCSKQANQLQPSHRHMAYEHLSQSNPPDSERDSDQNEPLETSSPPFPSSKDPCPKTHNQWLLPNYVNSSGSSSKEPSGYYHTAASLFLAAQNRSWATLLSHWLSMGGMLNWKFYEAYASFLTKMASSPTLTYLSFPMTQPPITQSDSTINEQEDETYYKNASLPAALSLDCQPSTHHPSKDAKVHKFPKQLSLPVESSYTPSIFNENTATPVSPLNSSVTILSEPSETFSSSKLDKSPDRLALFSSTSQDDVHQPPNSSSSLTHAPDTPMASTPPSSSPPTQTHQLTLLNDQHSNISAYLKKRQRRYYEEQLASPPSSPVDTTSSNIKTGTPQDQENTNL